MTLLTAPAEVFPPALPLMTEIWDTLLQQHPSRYRVVSASELR